MRVSEMIRKATNNDLTRIAEIEVFNYRLNFYPIFRDDEFYFDELQVPKRIEAFEALIGSIWVYDDGAAQSIPGFHDINGSAGSGRNSGSPFCALAAGSKAEIIVFNALIGVTAGHGAEPGGRRRKRSIGSRSRCGALFKLLFHGPLGSRSALLHGGVILGRIALIAAVFHNFGFASGQ